MRHNANNQMKTARRRYEGNHDDRLIRIALNMMEIRQYLFFHCPQNATHFIEHLGTEPLKNVLSGKTEPFIAMDIFPALLLSIQKES